VICTEIKIGDVKAIVCRGRGRRKKCHYCDGDEDFLCDFPVGKKRNGEKKDCDRSLCKNCTQKGVSPGVDFCREHYPIAKAAYEERQARNK
jgi:hypothetical protein